jgi:superfamily II DNA or RNA helicase
VVAARILAELFADEPAAAPAPERAHPLTDFQEAGVMRARSILARWGGVLIADSVGLGKTYVGLALIEEELRRGGVVVVAIPASLRPTWRPALRRLRGRYEGEVRMLSHAQLSRGGYSPRLAGRVTLAVVDEAHRFRNPRTRRHAALRSLCAGARMVLLTATPVNNGVVDLLGLLSLFAEDDAFTGVGVPSLRQLLAPAPGVRSATASGAPASPALTRLLRAIMIRRTRRTVLRSARPGTLPGARVQFPVRSPPHLVRYDDPRTTALVDLIASLELAPYGLGERGATDAGGVEALIRLALLKRLESSAPALRRSTTRLLGFCRSFLGALEAGRLLRPHPRGRSGARDADPLQLVLFDLVAEPIPPGVDRAQLGAAVRRDIDRLQRMDRLLDADDPKLAALDELLQRLAPEKVVVFTEFRDTAEAVWRPLTRTGAVARIDGDAAWLGHQQAGRSAVVRRFAPAANDADPPPARERVDVLIATDVLAEGMNLQDARHVVSYDLPWNPVRLLQRIGRVDRLGSPHQTVVPHLFLPAAGLDAVLALTRRLSAKLGHITASVGGDEAATLMERLSGGALAAEAALDQVEAGQEDALEALRAAWREHQRTQAPGPAAALPATDVGPGAVATVTVEEGTAVVAIVLARFRGRAWLLEIEDGGRIQEAGEPSARIIGAALAGPATALSRPGDDENLSAALLAIRDQVRRHFAAQDCVARAPRPVQACDPGARLARRLRSALADADAWADPELMARADAALQRLAVPLAGHARDEARALLAEAEAPASAARLLDGVEAVVTRSRGPADTPARDPSQAASEASLVAVLMVSVAGAERAGTEPRREVDDADARG